MPSTNRSLKSPSDKNRSSNIGAPAALSIRIGDSVNEGEGRSEEDINKLDDIAQMAYNKMQEYKEYRHLFDKSWDSQYRYWAGEQKTGKVAWRSDATINEIFPIIESIVAHMTDADPVPTISPCEEAFVESADIIQQVLYRTWIDNGMSEKLQNIVRDTLTYGTSYAKVWYDKKKNLVTIDAIDVRHIYPSPGAENVEDARAVILCKNVPKDSVEMRFPKSKGHLDGNAWMPEATFIKNVTSADQHRDIPGIMIEGGQYPGVSSKDGGTPIDVQRNSVTYIEYWYRNADDEYKIWCATVANGYVLSHKRCDEWGGRFPFVKFVDVGLTETWYGMGEVQQLKKLQDALNGMASLVMDLMKLNSNPPFLMPTQSGIQNNSLANVPGIMLPYVHPFKPEWMRPGEINPAIFQFIQQKKLEMIDVSGISDSSQGRKPTGVTAASGIALSAEISQTRIRPKLRNMKASLIVLGELMLAGIQKFYTAPQIIRVAGRRMDKLGHFVKVNQPALDEDNNVIIKNNLAFGKYDVNISMGSLPDYDQAAKYEQVKELFGMLGPQYVSPRMVFESVPDMTQEETEDALMNAQQGAPPAPGGEAVEGRPGTAPPTQSPAINPMATKTAPQGGKLGGDFEAQLKAIESATQK